MILYFSGTGNSRLVANELAELLSDEAFDVATLQTLRSLSPDEALGIVFPVYAWGVPTIVERFISTLPSLLSAKPTYVWSVMTCGDDMGYTDRRLKRAFRLAELPEPQAIYSVQMPNTYVCLPGFDVDSADVAKRKCEASHEALRRVVETVAKRRSELCVVRGGMAWLKTYVLRPLFNRALISDKPFRVDAEKCTGCSLCAKQCPVADIVMRDGKPTWTAHRCTSCLRCYHHCPQRAIDWGRWTKGKGQQKS